MVASRSTLYWRRYVVYVVVAAVVGAITVAIRELIALLLGRDTPLDYAVSVLVAYGCGIVLSFFWQGRVTFRQHGVRQRRGRFSIFAVMAIVSSVLTVMLSRLLRYEGGFDQLFGPVGPGLAFAIAAIITSFFTYAANARFVFASETAPANTRK